MKKDDSVFLQHILESIEYIEEFVENKSKSEFEESVMLQDAVIRRLGVLGEAAKNLSNSIIQKHTEIAWKKIAGTRDKLIHGYFGIDLDIVWSVIKTDLPELKEKIQKILRELKINK